MTLIKSISGIRGTMVVNRGTISHLPISYGLRQYATFIRNKSTEGKTLIVVGRDARISGEMVHRIITGTLIAMGCDVTDIGLATTPQLR